MPHKPQKEKKPKGSFKCPVPGCDATLDLLTHVHVTKHGMTKEQFLERYPEYESDYYWGTAPNRNGAERLEYLKEYKKNRREVKKNESNS